MPTMELMDPRMQNLFACAEKVGLPVVYDGTAQRAGDFGVYDDPGLPMLEYCLLAFPKLKIFGHGPTFWAELFKLETPAERGYVFTWNGDGDQVGKYGSDCLEEGVMPKMLRRHENLYVDMSDGSPLRMLSKNKEFTKKFLAEFQDRCYFGTDLCNKYVKYRHVEFINQLLADGVVTQEIYDKITHKNAEKLLGLSD